MNEFIFLYGPPGVGKSTIGNLLAKILNLQFIDLDTEIVKRAQMSIQEIFSDKGEDEFRALEQETLNEILTKTTCVIALGGGALLNNDNRDKVKAFGQVVCLDGSINVLSERLQHSSIIRPLISKNASGNLKNLLSQRVDHYASFLQRCNTDHLTPDEVVWEVQKLIGHFYIKGMGNGYHVNVQNGSLDHIGQIISSIGLKGSICVVSDENVAPLYAQRVITLLEKANFKTQLHIIQAGESHKNSRTVSELWDAFISAKLDRGSAVIALGGGVVGDLAGFAAATYMRGINWINVPTTLLAMVDSSIGGKTGFDLPQGKNLVGAFHSPAYVLIDPELLVTLPENEVQCGMAEVVKHGVVGSPTLFDQCMNGFPNNFEDREKLVRDALSVKVNIIQIDPYEKGYRAALNLGHTIGHAVELLSNFNIPHGEAVAIGLMAEARLAGKLGMVNNKFIDLLMDALTGLGLPTEIPEHMNKVEIIQAMLMDKKVTNENIRFSLPESVGKVKVGVVVDELDKLFAQI